VALNEFMSIETNIATLDAVQRSHSDSIERLSGICTELAHTIGDINTTQKVAMEILTGQQRQLDDVKKQTTKLFEKTDEFDAFRQQSKGGGFAWERVMAYVAIAIAAWTAYRTH